jgi:hypothetical protein
MSCSSALNSRKTLIFHIGDHKTGSTSIQLAFAQRQVVLPDGPIFYPNGIASNRLGDHCRAYLNKDRPNAHERAKDAFQRLAMEIRNSPAKICLVSAEALEGVSGPVFANIVADFFSDVADDIRVFAYVRPHAARIVSSFAELIKCGVPVALKSSLEEFANHKEDQQSFFYHPRFQGWRDAFGHQFTLRPMIRDFLFRQNVVDDFVHHALAADDFTIKEGASANESLCLEDLMRLKVLHFHVLSGTSPGERRTLGWEFARVVGQLPIPESRTKLKLHRALAQKIRVTYLKDARAIDHDFFAGQPLMEQELDRSIETALSQDQSTDPADYLPNAELRSLEVLSKIVAGMLEAKQVEWPAFLHRKRLKDVENNRLPNIEQEIR